MSIINAEYYKLYRGVDLSDDQFNTEELNQFIAQAEALMERYTDRKFSSEAIVGELFSGGNTPQYFVKHKRITTLSNLYYWNGTAWTEITSPTYVFTSEQDTGRIYFQDSHTFFSNSLVPLNWKVNYTCGWSDGDMPIELKECCCEIVRWLYLKRKKAGIASETLGDKNVSYETKSVIPSSAREILSAYRKIGYA